MADRREPLTDDSPCPFGKHKGKPLRRVPLWYWHWFIVQEFCAYWPALEACFASAGGNVPPPAAAA